MIDLELTEEHIALQNTVREFCAGEVAPFIKEWDEKSHFERSVFDKMAELKARQHCSRASEYLAHVAKTD